jgi:hypothetical protein
MNIFLPNISSNQVTLGKNVSKWRDFYNPYCMSCCLFELLL